MRHHETQKSKITKGVNIVFMGSSHTFETEISDIMDRLYPTRSWGVVIGDQQYLSLCGYGEKLLSRRGHTIRCILDR